MSETKRQKRIVSKGRYVLVMGEKTWFYSRGVLLVIVGTLVLLCTVWGSLASMHALSHAYRDHDVRLEAVILTGMEIIGSYAVYLSYYCFGHSKKLFVQGIGIERVAPITVQNAHLLPFQATLVRSSDLPPTEQQAELLRAVQTSQDTSSEQLLRAEQGEAE